MCAWISDAGKYKQCLQMCGQEYRGNMSALGQGGLVVRVSFSAEGLLHHPVSAVLRIHEHDPES